MKQLLYKRIIFFLFVFSFTVSYSQQAQTCKGYLIIQETNFKKPEKKMIDSLFMTKNYKYQKSHYLNSTNLDSYNFLIDFALDSFFAISFYPPVNSAHRKITIQSGLPVLEGKYISVRLPLLHDTNCTDSVIFLNEQKKIEGLQVQKIMIINSPDSNYNMKADTTIAFVTKGFDFYKNNCLPGLMMESENRRRKTRTLKVIETLLPENSDWILEGAKDRKDLDTFNEKFWQSVPFSLEDVKQQAKEMNEE